VDNFPAMHPIQRKKKIWALCLLFIFAFSSFFPSKASADTVLFESLTTPEAFQNFGNSSNWDVTWIKNSTHDAFDNVTQFCLYAKRTGGSPGTLSLEVKNASNTLLASSSQDATAWSTSDEWHCLTLDNEIDISANAEYLFYFRWSGTSNNVQYYYGFQDYSWIGRQSGCTNTSGSGCSTDDDAEHMFQFRGNIAPTESSITLTSPTEQTYLSNPITFAGEYTNIHFFDQIQFDVDWNNSMNIVFDPINLPLINGADLPFSTSRNLPFQGNYTVRARLWDSVNASSTAWTTPISFGLGTTTVATSSNPIGQPLEALECDDGILGWVECSIKRSMVWLFYPSIPLSTRMSEISTDLEGKFPFSYAYDTLEIRDEMFDATETASTSISSTIEGFGTINFLSKSMIASVPYAGLIKTILGWLLWIFMVEYIYYRVVRIHDPNTPTS